MKKLISILLGAAMLLSLAACTSTAAADDTESVPASSDTSTETPPEKPDGTPPDGANGQLGTIPDGNPPDGAPNGQPGGFGGSVFRPSAIRTIPAVRFPIYLLPKPLQK